jgi:hypothetical protein
LGGIGLMVLFGDVKGNVGQTLTLATGVIKELTTV